MFTQETLIVTGNNPVTTLSFGDAAYQWETTEDPIRVLTPSLATLYSDCRKSGESQKAYAVSFKDGLSAIVCSESHRWDFLRSGSDTSYTETSQFLRVGDVVPTLAGYVTVTQVKSLNFDVPVSFYQLSIPMVDLFLITDGVNILPVLSETP